MITPTEALELIQSFRPTRGSTGSYRAGQLQALQSVSAIASTALRVKPQEEGEVAELVQWLRNNAKDERDTENGGTVEAADFLDRSATLLEQNDWCVRNVQDVLRNAVTFAEGAGDHSGACLLLLQWIRSELNVQP
jgi:hypothetical protein